MNKQEDYELSIKDVVNLINDDFNAKFSDVIGYKKEKEELIEIKDFFLSNEKYKQMGARIPKDVLLVGQPGCGKTLLAKALISELNINSLVYDNTIESSNFTNLKKIFSLARKNAPCIIFIDEIDKLIITNPIISRESPFLRELLSQLGGFNENNKVIVIATANKPLDSAPSLMRSGRFDRIINIRLPNKEERRDIFIHYSQDKPISDNVDFDMFARMTSV